MGPHRLASRGEIAVAQSVGDALVLADDGDQALRIARRFTDHPHLAIAQRRVEPREDGVARGVEGDLVKGAIGVEKVGQLRCRGGLALPLHLRRKLFEDSRTRTGTTLDHGTGREVFHQQPGLQDRTHLVG